MKPLMRKKLNRRVWTTGEPDFSSTSTSSNPGLIKLIPWNNIVITMKAIHVSIRRIGNSQGVVIPKPVLAQLGLNREVGAEMTIEGGALVLRAPAGAARKGWAE